MQDDVDSGWLFEDPADSVVVTTDHVTSGQLPALYVSRERDEEGDIVWFCLCMTVPFDMKDARMVRLDTILDIDVTVGELYDLPIGHCATRATQDDLWEIEPLAK